MVSTDLYLKSLDTREAGPTSWVPYVLAATQEQGNGLNNEDSVHALRLRLFVRAE